MLGIIQKTEVSIPGGGIPWQLLLLVLLVVILVIGVIVWLYRGVRKTIHEDDEWRYDQYSLMKAEPQERVKGADVSPDAVADLSPSPVSEPTLAPGPGVARGMPVEPVDTQPPPSPPRPPQTPAPPAEPILPTAKRPVPTGAPSAVAPVEPAPPTARFTQPVAAPEKALEAEEAVGGEPMPSPPGPDQPFFQTFEYEVKQEQRSHTIQLVVGAVLVILVAVYLLVFPVQDAVNSAVANLSQRLSHLFKGPPTAPAQLATMPQLDIVQEVTTRGTEVVIVGRVRNLSSDSLGHLFAEFALIPVGIELTETRLVPIQPNMLAPNQEGQYRIQIRSDEFSKYQLARIITADNKEVTFKLSLALPAPAPRQP